MSDALVGLRNILQRMQQPGNCRAETRPVDHEKRLAAHERRIHNHPCPCGSGRRYVDCCINRPNQEQLELRHRRRMRTTREDV